MIWAQPVDTVLIRFFGHYDLIFNAKNKWFTNAGYQGEGESYRHHGVELCSTGCSDTGYQNVDLLNAVIEGAGQFTMSSNLRVYDAFDINNGDIIVKQGTLISNGFNINCRTFLLTAGGSKTFNLGAADTLTTINFTAVDAFTFPYAPLHNSKELYSRFCHRKYHCGA